MSKMNEKEIEYVPQRILYFDSLDDREEAYSLMRSLALELSNKINASQKTQYDVYIPATKEKCVASLSLDREGQKYKLIILNNKYDYGKFLSDLWGKGNGFIVVEHDIAPWPGAIEDLMFCNHPWCAYRYFYEPGQLIYAMGCIKFSNWIVNEYPNFHNDMQWEKQNWITLDRSIVRPLLELSGFHPHLHEPPLAHVKVLL